MGRRVEYLTPPKARGLVEEAIAPLLADFQPVRPGVWARPLSAEVRAMLTLQSWKGATFSLTYGVCCSWVPYRSGGGNRYEWPATVKQSHPHLWVDHFSVDAPREEYISYIEGEAQLRRTALTAMNAAAERAPGWWRGVREPEGVLAEARRQAGSQMDLHWPSALFVEAFTLARLGQQVGAASALVVPVWRNWKGGRSPIGLLAYLRRWRTARTWPDLAADATPRFQRSQRVSIL